MKNNKGFTLVEILAVVVLLGVLVIIATNIIFSQVKKSKKNAFVADVQGYIKSTNYDTLVGDKIDKFVVYKFPESGLELISDKKMKVDGHEVYVESGFMIKNENEQIRIQIWNKKLNACAVKSFTDTEVKIDESLDSESKCLSFVPELVDGKEVSVKAITGEDVDATLKPSCYTLDADYAIDNFDTSSCGTVMVVPNKINGHNITGFTDDFGDNAPHDFTAFYMVGVDSVTETPTSLLASSPDLEKGIIFDDPNLQTIKSGIFNSSKVLTTMYLSNLPELTTIQSGVIYTSLHGLKYLTLHNLPKLTSLSSCFEYAELEDLIIDNLDSLTEITSMAFYKLKGDTNIRISNNDNLIRITNTSLSESYISKLEIDSNKNFLEITNGALGGGTASNGYYIDELLIHDNPNLETLQNGAFQGYNFKTVKMYNNPKLKNIRYSAFSSITADVVDLSGLELESLDFTGWGGAKIKKLILPPTITQFNYGSAGSLNSIVTESIEFGGSDKCSLIGLFRTDLGNGSYSYSVNPSKLPSCP